MSTASSNRRYHSNLSKVTPLLLGLAGLGSSAHVRAEAAPPAPAQDLSAKFAIDPNDPENSVPDGKEAMKNPLEMGYLMMDLIARADAATKRGDHATAAKFYRALGKAVPERAVSFSKLCQSYEAMGEREKAAAACREALGKGGVELADYARFVHLTLQQPEPLSPVQVEDIDAIASHIREQLKADPQGRIVAAQVACELATRLEDVARLTACTGELAQIAPQDPRTVTFQFALALKQQDFDGAETLIADARRTALPAPAIDAMDTQLARARKHPGGFRGFMQAWGPFGGLTTALGLALLLLSRRKPKLQAA